MNKYLTNMKILFVILSLCISTGYAQEKTIIEEHITSSLNSWHQAATEANFETYFDLMTDDAIFVGTDATERWTISEFKTYTKPHFDAGKAWDFTVLERTIYSDNSDTIIAWFEEHLNTQMGICRGSGVLQKVGDTWKIKHYVLSIAVPNEHVAQLTALKKEWDTTHINKILNKS